MHKKKWPHCLCSLTVLFWLVSCILISFYPVNFGVWLLVVNTSVVWLLFMLFSLCLWFLLLICYCSFCICKKPPLTCVPTYRVPCPLGPSHSFFLCPPVSYCPTTPIHIIRGHPYTFGLVYVYFLSECVHMCVCCHKLARCVRVCLLACLLCVRGVWC